MTMRCSLKSITLALAILALATSTPAAIAGTFQWNDDTSITANTWNRPLEDRSGLSGEIVTYSSLAIYVDESGEYTITSEQQFDGFLAVYGGHFDATDPLRDLIAANDDSGPNTSQVTIQLAAGVIYHVVTTGSTSGDQGLALNRVAGDGEPRPSACFLGDETLLSDDGDDSNALNMERFCVFVDWRTKDGKTGVGRLTGNRAADSTLFYFFDRDNWELMVKVLDGCGFNNHYWVFTAGATNVEYTLTVIDLQTFESKTYTNPLGQVAETVTDTRAFQTCP